MIKEIEICLEGDCAISYVTERGRDCLPFSAILPYWDYASEDEIEGVRVYRMADAESLMVLFSVASSQGGALVCWNTRTRTVTHISDAAYALAACLYEGKIYILLDVFDFATPAHFLLERVPLGLKDMAVEPEQAELAVSEKIENFSGSYDEANLSVDAQGVTVQLGEAVFHCDPWPEN